MAQLIVANRPRVTPGATGKALPLVYGTARVPVIWLWQGHSSAGPVTVWDGGWQRDGQTSTASNGKRCAVLGAICERPWTGQPSHATGSWWRDGQWLPSPNMRWLLADTGVANESTVFSGEASWPSIPWISDLTSVATVSLVGVQAGDWFKVSLPDGSTRKLTAVLSGPGTNEFVTAPTNDVTTAANLANKLNTFLPGGVPPAPIGFANWDTPNTFFLLQTVGWECYLSSGQTVNGADLPCPRIICSSERTIGSPDQPAGITHMRSTLLGMPSGTLPTIEVELLGDFHRATSVPYALDADPADVLVNLMARAGWSSSDVVVDLGGDGLAASSYRRWCTASGFFVSRAILDTINTMEAVRDLLVDTWSTGFESGGKFCVRPLGTKSVTGALGTYTPDTTAAVPITIDDLTEPLVVERLPQSGDTATRNAFPVTFRDRDADYQESTVESLNDAHAQTNGVLRADPTTARWVSRSNHALRLSALLAQRSEQVRNKYRLTVRPEVGALLEPCDRLAITDAVWGITAQLCRVRAIEWQDGKGYLVTAEDIPDHSPIAIASTRFSADGLTAGAVRPAAAYAAASDAAAALPGKADTNMGNVPPATVSAGQLTTGNQDNLWPNPSGELVPPSGSGFVVHAQGWAPYGAEDTSSAEWSNLATESGAYVGTTVRRIVGGTAVYLDVPCSPGDRFYAQAQAKRYTGTGNVQLGVIFLDSQRHSVSPYTGDAWISPPSNQAVWSQVSATTGAAPAWACFARMVLSASAADTLADFDAISWRRMIPGSVVSFVKRYSAQSSSGSTDFQVTFPVAEPDSNYLVLPTTVAVTGTVPDGALILESVVRSTTGISLSTRAAPSVGGANWVSWEFAVIRLT